MRRLIGGVVLAGALMAAMSAPVTGAAAAGPRHAPSAATEPATANAARRASSPPVLAYYYIWFDQASWSRAKTDLPKLGPYSSDDASVMRRQVRWAKQAGIEGFLVSWKHTPTLDRRLKQLVDIAERERFGLGIVYQGLDFQREALPPDRVATDLDYFATTFASRKPFELFARPLVVWSGTWKFSPEQIAWVTTPRRGALTILSSERNVDGYVRIAGSVDGDAYYWSSVNPTTFPGYVEKLTDLGREVHARNGLWIAPAAPGFDARTIGGTSTVARVGDRTLVDEIDAALASSPDALGIISWNEFTENSHIEPSLRYGWTALNAVSVRLGRGPVGATGDHGTGRAISPGEQARVAATGATGALDATGSGTSGPASGVWVIAGFALLFVALVVVMARRAHRSPPLRVVVLADVGGRALRHSHPPALRQSTSIEPALRQSTSIDSSHAAMGEGRRRQAPRPGPRRGVDIEGSIPPAQRRRKPWYRVVNERPARRRSGGS